MTDDDLDVLLAHGNGDPGVIRLVTEVRSLQASRRRLSAAVRRYRDVIAALTAYDPADYFPFIVVPPGGVEIPLVTEPVLLIPEGHPKAAQGQRLAVNRYWPPDQEGLADRV